MPIACGKAAGVLGSSRRDLPRSCADFRLGPSVATRGFSGAEGGAEVPVASRRRWCMTCRRALRRPSFTLAGGPPPNVCAAVVLQTCAGKGRRLSHSWWPRCPALHAPSAAWPSEAHWAAGEHWSHLPSWGGRCPPHKNKRRQTMNKCRHLRAERSLFCCFPVAKLVHG